MNKIGFGFAFYADLSNVVFSRNVFRVEFALTIFYNSFYPMLFCTLFAFYIDFCFKSVILRLLFYINFNIEVFVVRRSIDFEFLDL